MDEEAELQKLRWILVAGVVFLCSGYYSWQELKFLVWGQTAEAQVTRAYTTTETKTRAARSWMGTRSRQVEKLVVEYTFTDSATGPRSERDVLSSDWPPPGDKVTVQYFPGMADSSRLSGHSHSFSVWLFFGSLVALGIAIVWIARQDQPLPRRRKRR